MVLHFISMNSLRGRVAVVAGATRGAGRGIAAALGEAGATVICTGRSSRTGELISDYAGRPETIEETAELGTRLGGLGISKVVDHLDPAQVLPAAASGRDPDRASGKGTAIRTAFILCRRKPDRCRCDSSPNGH